ncbi:hypothetical protein Hanom_Chr14g01326831 [Helianthus anomalus]
MYKQLTIQTPNSSNSKTKNLTKLQPSSFRIKCLVLVWPIRQPNPPSHLPLHRLPNRATSKPPQHTFSILITRENNTSLPCKWAISARISVPKPRLWLKQCELRRLC